MTPKLFVARYKDFSYAGGKAPNEIFEDVQDIGLRWSLPGGIQKISFTVKSKSWADSVDRYRNHLGHLIAVYDSFADRPITGNIYEIVPDGRFVHYICAGPWKRCFDEIYNVTDTADLTYPASYTSAVIKDILDDKVPISNSNQANIDSTSVNIGGWNPSGGMDHDGIFPGDAILELAAQGNSTNDPVDFYFVDAPFSYTALQKPLPYLKARSTSATADYSFSIKDVAEDGLTLSRNIWDLATYVKVGFGRIEGTHDGGNNLAYLSDASATFLDKVKIGDRVINLTQNTISFVSGVPSDTRIDFQPVGHGGDWDTGDDYSVELDNLQWTTQATDADWWVKAGRPLSRALDADSAALLRDQYHAIYKEPILQAAFVLSSPTLHAAQSNPVPLWRVLFGDSFYFYARDIFPAASLYSEMSDGFSSFMAVAIDYEHAANRLRIVPSTGDTRLDVLLGKALQRDNQISRMGQMISTASGRDTGDKWV